MSTALAGQCHCGAIHVTLVSSRPVAELPLRTCLCGFCRRRGGTYTSDPDGQLRIEAQAGAVSRYRFGQGGADFLLCSHCGTFIAATAEIEGDLRSVLNVRGADMPGFEGRPADVMSYDDETPDDRLARRKARWTPTTLVESQTSIAL